MATTDEDKFKLPDDYSEALSKWLFSKYEQGYSDGLKVGRNIAISNAINKLEEINLTFDKRQNFHIHNIIRKELEQLKKEGAT